MDPTKVPINHVPASHPRKIPDLLRGRCSNAPKLGLQFLLTVGERQRAGNVTIASAAMVGYAYDYETDHHTGWHQHPRAQLLHAISGTMRVATAAALFIVPPGTGLWVPAHTEHVTRMPGGLAMRGLFLREDGARAGPYTVTVVAISPLLQALILAACEQPVMWTRMGQFSMSWRWRFTRSAVLRRARSRYRRATMRACGASPRRFWRTRRTRAD